MGRKPTLTHVMREEKTHVELEPALRLVSKRRAGGILEDWFPSARAQAGTESVCRE